ncbi:sensor histidine kinase [Psychrobacillus vulpis]|uniref:histidine kinase n=1 Tax=Psychrobacillus vulpis TaxID=2325572 RepID=A0A544TJ70_9BACI|nr:HAMP domain-containing sensor histidine kinase [Psychrobacillus vulpis]TQR17505.1 HAMP domain-containing histidine kinase [Psychrobacillus vulpis]
MSLSGKMTIRFLAYFVVFYGFLLIASSGLTAFVIYDIISTSSYTNIRDLDAFELEEDIKKDIDGTYHLSQKLIDSANANNGVVQLIDKKGTVLASSKKGYKCCTSYLISDFVAMSKSNEAFVWIQENSLYLVFIENHPAKQLLSTAVQQYPDELSIDIKKQLSDAEASFEIYDAVGKRQQVVFGASQKALNGVEILAGSHDYTERKEIVASELLEDGTTAVVRMSNSLYHPFEPAFKNGLKKFALAILIFHILLLLFIILFSFWIGNRFGRPVLYFLRRIEKLGKQDYASLDDRKLRTKKTGRFKRKYRVYEDIDQSLSQLTHTLKENERKILQTEKLREDWITGLSHDLKTPLSSIYGYSTMLSSKDYEWSDDEVKTFAETMKEKASYMDALIDDLTYTYQLKNNAIAIERLDINLYDYIYNYVCNSIWPNLHVPSHHSNVHVFIDPKLFARVLDNLVGNAIKHTPEGTNVFIEIGQKKEQVYLQVKDEGNGIPAEELENLFDRYYRGTNTTSDVSGTGLGLAITKQLVEAHDGEIRVESNNQGTIITIILPSI